MADIPKSDRFERALSLLIIAHRLPDAHRRMLLAHYRAPGHTMTATELAEVAGYANYNAVNLQYGTFGANLAQRLRWPVPPDKPQAFTFATFEGGGPDEPHTRWILRPEMAEALERLGWVRRRSDGPEHPSATQIEG